MIDTRVLNGVEDFRIFLPSNNFGAGGQARSFVESSRRYTDEGVIWQGDVYKYARILAEEIGARRVIDIGSGAGQKLLTFFEGYQADFVQVDFSDVRESRPGRLMPRFVKANLEDQDDLAELLRSLESGEPTLIILSDVIEHLLDPRPLLRVLRRLLRLCDANRLVLSTPDRERIDGIGSVRVPDNPSHVRQWTLSELGLALSSAAFTVVNLGYVNQNQFDQLLRTCVVVLSSSQVDYQAFFRRHHLPQPSDHIVITTEHGRGHVTGGIGSYYEATESYFETPRIVLFVGSYGLPDDWEPFIRKSGWIHINDLSGPSDGKRPINSDAILEATLHALFLYDEIRIVEFQDFGGIGHRVAQAGRAHMFPPDVRTLAVAHGSHFYLDHAFGDIQNRDPFIFDVPERLSLELADHVLFPTEFIRKLYVNQQGISVRDFTVQGFPIGGGGGRRAISEAH